MSENEDDETWFRKRFGGSNVWQVTPGKGSKHWGEFQKRSIMAAGFEDVGNLSKYESQEAVLEKLREIVGTNPDPTWRAVVLWEFKNGVKVGDILVSTSGRKKIFGTGEVTGEYEYDPEKSRFPALANGRMEVIPRTDNFAGYVDGDGRRTDWRMFQPLTKKMGALRIWAD